MTVLGVPPGAAHITTGPLSELPVVDFHLFCCRISLITSPDLVFFLMISVGLIYLQRPGRPQSQCQNISTLVMTHQHTPMTMFCRTQVPVLKGCGPKRPQPVPSAAHGREVTRIPGNAPVPFSPPNKLWDADTSMLRS